jgi:hypothetical protein
MRWREAVMGGKYSAEWWNKIAGISRDMAAGHDPSRIVDDLIQATASGKPAAGGKSENGRSRFASLESSRVFYVE